MRGMTKEIFSERIEAGRRVYFIDVKESRSGVKCPVISESRMSEEKRAGGGLSRTHPFLREGVGEGFGSPWYRVFKRQNLQSSRDPQQVPESLHKMDPGRRGNIKRGISPR